MGRSVFWITSGEQLEEFGWTSELPVPFIEQLRLSSLFLER